MKIIVIQQLKLDVHLCDVKKPGVTLKLNLDLWHFLAKYALRQKFYFASKSFESVLKTFCDKAHDLFCRTVNKILAKQVSRNSTEKTSAVLHPRPLYNTKDVLPISFTFNLIQTEKHIILRTLWRHKMVGTAMDIFIAFFR